MTKDEVLDLALEALGQMQAKANFECWNLDICDKAITAIKQALAKDALYKLAEESCTSGLRLDDWDKIGCVNHDCDKCKAVQEPVLQDIEQYRLQMAGISTAAIGYWKEGDGIHPDYDTPALRDVAKLYAKYDALYTAAQPTTKESSAVAAPVQSAERGEPVAWIFKPNRELLWPNEVERKNPLELNEYAPLYTTPSAAPVQEPVAFEDWHSANYVQPLEKYGDSYKNMHVRNRWQGWLGAKSTPPAAQRQWVGLTDEEFEDIELGCRSTSSGKIEAMQKVEAKLRSRNNG